MKVEFKINRDCVWVGVDIMTGPHYTRLLINPIPCVSIMVVIAEFNVKDKKRLLKRFNQFLKVKSNLEKSLDKRDNYKKTEYGKQYSSLLNFLKNELTGESLRKFEIFLDVSYRLTDELVSENKMIKNQYNDLIKEIREELKR